MAVKYLPQGYLDFSKLFAGGVHEECPYSTQWSLRPLISKSEELTEEDIDFLETIEASFAQESSNRPNEKDVILSFNQVKQLLRFFFPPFKKSIDLGALAKPFSSLAMVTSNWNELVSSGSLKKANIYENYPLGVRVGMLILNKLYGQQLIEVEDLVVDYCSEATGLVTNYRFISGFDHVDILINGEKPVLQVQDIRLLLSNLMDEKVWLKMLPPSIFSVCGVEVIHVLDFTKEISQDRLQRLLLKREAVLSERRIAQMQTVLRNIFQLPNLTLGIQALDYPLEKAISHRYLIRQDLLKDEVDFILNEDHGKSIYRQTCISGGIKIFDNLEDAYLPSTIIEKKLIELGYRSIVLVPLFGKADHIVGMLELASEKPYAFSTLALYKLDAIVPLFRQAVRRGRAEIEARIQSTMRQQFTALDPSVEWRFVEAAVNIIEHKHAEGKEDEPFVEPIRFENVWALYSQADIVKSSLMRNEAIRADLLNELSAAKQFLENPAIKLRFPLSGKLVFDINELSKALIDEMSPNEEQHVLDFLRKEFRPTLNQLAGLPDMELRIAEYHKILKSKLTNGYTHQEAYERSVRRVTSVINGVIRDAQEEAQRIIPHFFNKYRTDGVEISIYAGQSLLKSGVFSEIHLENLRLWQLQTMVYVTKAIAGIQNSLDVPMSTAQLIFAYGNAITIQFRMDEKRFDVEGAYNVRYEVIKKRIDKALIRGSEERLTQTEHIAIVYSHHSDKKRYLEFIDYLYRSGEIVGQAEDLELEPMQGVDGLNAIRFRVVDSPTKKYA